MTLEGQDLMPRLITIAAILTTVACGSTEPIACTTEFVYGISVQVVDATTSAPVSEGLSGELMEAQYTETMEVFGNTLVGAGERPGNYSIVVSAPGYEAWSRSGIEVLGGSVTSAR